MTRQPELQSVNQRKKSEYNPEVSNLVNVLKQVINIAGYEMVGRVTLKNKITGKEYH